MTNLKKFETTAKYNEVKEAAKELGIKFVGVKTAILIELVNAEIEKQQPTETTEFVLIKQKKTPTPSKTLADYGLEEGQIVKIKGFEVKGKMILVDREVMITRPSRAKGYIKGRLINTENGEAQKTEIAITADIIIQGANLPSIYVVA